MGRCGGAVATQSAKKRSEPKVAVETAPQRYGTKVLLIENRNGWRSGAVVGGLWYDGEMGGNGSA